MAVWMQRGIALLCLLSALLCAQPGTVMTTSPTAPGPVVGALCIPAAGVKAELRLIHEDCACCGLGLWGGGVVDMPGADLSAVQIGDRAYVEQGELSLVLECVEVLEGLRVGNTLIGWRGVVRSDGDVLIFDGNRVYRFVVL